VGPHHGFGLPFSGDLWCEQLFMFCCPFFLLFLTCLFKSFAYLKVRFQWHGWKISWLQSWPHNDTVTNDRLHTWQHMTNVTYTVCDLWGRTILVLVVHAAVFVTEKSLGHISGMHPL
jgi:uncharacterized membrane protein YbaN (DUF454 family)